MKDVRNLGRSQGTDAEQGKLLQLFFTKGFQLTECLPTKGLSAIKMVHGFKSLFLQ